MKTDAAFWDTSALIPLCCDQLITPAAQRVRRSMPRLIAWWGTHVEFHSGVARLGRESAIDSRQKLIAVRRWRDLIFGTDIVAPSTKLLEIAVDLPERYAVRSLDAFQLAAALVWCREKPRNRPFVSADARLANAAIDAGFDAVALAD